MKNWLESSAGCKQPMDASFTKGSSGFDNMPLFKTGGVPLLRFRVWRCFVFLSILDRTGWFHSGGDSDPGQKPSLEKEPQSNY